MTKRNIRTLQTLLILLSLFMATAALAVPQNISYQGKLTDSSGNPLTGTYDMRFFLCDAVAGGTCSWDETQIIDVTSGIYNVQLGTVPFTAGLFDDDLYLEVLISDDGGTTWETLSPRQQLTSTGYAIKAEDADTLDGQHASAFASSSHTLLTDNPHNVTAAQLGASTGPHTIDTNAETICGNGQYLRGDGVCIAGFLDSDGVDAYNSNYDTEAEIDAAVANNGYSAGSHTTDTNAASICPDNTFLNGDGTCDPAPVNPPEVNSSAVKNTSGGATMFDETSHKLLVTYTGGNNDFTILSKNIQLKRILIDDATGSPVKSLLSAVDATLTKNISSTRIATIDLIETPGNTYSYRCIPYNTNLISCIQMIH